MNASRDLGPDRPTKEEELRDFRVFGDSLVGWDAAVPPNEVVDEDGMPMETMAGRAPDPRCPPRRIAGDPEVEALRRHLKANNGIRGLEICTPDEVERATRIFRRDGFVVVRDALDAEHLALFREGCARVLKEILAMPGRDGRRYLAESGRLPHRYCYGTTSASRQMMHDRAWASMIDLPTTTPILKAIFASEDYGVWGGGGDLSLPGAIEYQHLHTDGIDEQADGDGRLAAYRRQEPAIDAERLTELPFRTQRLVMDHTSPGVTINFAMTDLTWENGPIREIPGTHTATSPPPKPDEEPEWMRLSTLVGAPAGSAIFRDVRAWHGATPKPLPRSAGAAEHRILRPIPPRSPLPKDHAPRNLAVTHAPRPPHLPLHQAGTGRVAPRRRHHNPAREWPPNSLRAQRRQSRQRQSRPHRSKLRRHGSPRLQPRSRGLDGVGGRHLPPLARLWAHIEYVVGSAYRRLGKAECLLSHGTNRVTH